VPVLARRIQTRCAPEKHTNPQVSQVGLGHLQQSPLEGLVFVSEWLDFIGYFSAAIVIKVSKRCASVARDIVTGTFAQSYPQKLCTYRCND
jgi:hypothetical protein